MIKVIGSLSTFPARAGLALYLGTISLGTVLLKLPMSQRVGAEPIRWLEALFTATSATCVTGLSVRSTQFDFSLIGQFVILALIQLGGLGIMTVTTFVLFGLSNRQSLHRRAVLADAVGLAGEPNSRWILGQVLLITFVAEGLGALTLFVRGLFTYSPLEAAWWAIFHAVSAFCNAGFSLQDDSLVRYQGDFVVNVTVGLLVIVGGLGYPVILDLRRSASRRGYGYWHRLQLHSKLMLIGTGMLLFGGTLTFLLLEWDNPVTLADKPWGTKLLIASFQSMTTRTAGFNTVDIPSLTNATLFIMILLMTIGAGPASTGGGFKVSTVMVLLFRAWATFRGRIKTVAFGRCIPEDLVDRAVSTAAIFVVIAVLALTTLLMFEQSTYAYSRTSSTFLAGAFEVVSALGTVGLSTGLTTKLSEAGQLIVIVLMFIGRLGPISIVVALSHAPGRCELEHPTEEPLIG